MVERCVSAWDTPVHSINHGRRFPFKCIEKRRLTWPYQDAEGINKQVQVLFEFEVWQVNVVFWCLANNNRLEQGGSAEEDSMWKCFAGSTEQ